MTNLHPLNPVPHAQLGDLTFREFEILLHIAQDYENREICSLTKLSPRTVINMRNRIGDKLLIKGRNKLGHFARQNKESLMLWFSIHFPGRK